MRIFTHGSCIFVRLLYIPKAIKHVQKMNYKTEKENCTVEETFGCEGSQFVSGCNNSPLHGTIASATIVIFFIEIM